MRWLAVLVIVISSSAAALSAAEPAEPPETVAQQLEKAQALLRDWRGEQVALTVQTCNQIAANPAATKPQKLQALDLVCQIRFKDRKLDEAVKAADALLAAAAGDAAVETKAMLFQIDALTEWNHNEPGIAKCQEFLKKFAADKPNAALAQYKLANLYQRTYKNKEAYEAATACLAADQSNDALVADALYIQQDAALRSSDYAKAADALTRLLEPKYLAQRKSDEYNNIRARYGECLGKLKRYDEALAFYAGLEKLAGMDPKAKQDWCLRTADTLLDKQQYDDALKNYERVFTDYPTLTERWYDAQKRIADALRKKGDLPGAAKAAHICLDAGGEANQVMDNARLVADCIKALDKDNVARANAFINFQKFGPAGPDKKPGTADDLKNPLDELGYPAYPQREQAFADARKSAGDSADAARYRALTYLYSGKPKEALRQFMDAFGRCPSQDMKKYGDDMIMLGARSVRGSAAGLDEFYNFVNFGPNGPDGKPGTADDLPDPFAALVK
jgi:tetratricopeptide (TPR) repeat protein